MLAAVLCCGVAVALIASVMLTQGCAASAAGRKVIEVQKAKDIAPALAATVSGSVIYGYSKDENVLVYAGAVKEALKQFIVAEDLQPAALQAAITALPMKELKTPEVQLVMGPIFASYKVFAEQRVKDGLKDNEGLRVLVQAMIDGIDAGQDAIRTIVANGG
jgi:hypothetical protein